MSAHSGGAVLATDETVAERTEAECRVLMAQRAALPAAWATRAERADLLAEVDGLLAAWLDVRP